MPLSYVQIVDERELTFEHYCTVRPVLTVGVAVAPETRDQREHGFALRKLNPCKAIPTVSDMRNLVEFLSGVFCTIRLM